MRPYYDANSLLISGRHQPALVVDYLQSLDLHPHELPAAIGMTLEDLASSGCLLSVRQFLKMLRAGVSLASVAGCAGISFELGRQFLPGHFGTASHALMRAGSLRRALELIVANPARLSPCLAPHLHVESGRAVLYWTDVVCAPDMRALLVEMHMCAIAAMCDWLGGARFPWHFCFNRTPPRATEQHEAHLGSRLRFNCHLDAMLIDADWLDRPWINPHASRSAAVADSLDRGAAAEEDRQSFLALHYRHLIARGSSAHGLEETAHAFELSPATLKRRLAAHGTHFQAELDQVRLHVALALIVCRGYDNDAVARHLGIDDATNFRRALKRWSGLTPALLRAGLSSP